jgi:hypothetical protein
MKERGILMQGESVLGILEGRKSQTRRVIKPQPPEECSIHYFLGNESWLDESKKAPLRHHWEAWGGELYKNRPEGWLCGAHEVKSPYGQPGDRLWVRETWMPFTEAGVLLHEAIYKAADRPEPDGDTPLKWRPPIFMPRWASRITLEVVNVRVERVQDISEEDCKSEGIKDLIVGVTFSDKKINLSQELGLSYRDRYKYLWNSINAKRGYGWDVNPYVWVIEFKVLP